MTTTLYLPEAAYRSAPTHHVTRTAVMAISAMPKKLRMKVENVMALCVPSEPELYAPGQDPMMCDWFTRWSTDRGASMPGDYRVRCRQVLTGTDDELESLEHVLGTLARDYGFAFSMTYVD